MVSAARVVCVCQPSAALIEVTSVPAFVESKAMSWLFLVDGRTWLSATSGFAAAAFLSLGRSLPVTGNSAAETAPSLLLASTLSGVS